MASKKISELSAKVPVTSDVLAVADPSTGIAGKSTCSQVVNAGLGSVNSITFNVGAGIAPVEGQVAWDSTYNTLSIGLNGGAVTQRVGFANYYRIKASSAITKGQLCRATGAVGNSGVIEAAPNITGLITNGIYIIGVAQENIDLNGFGDICAFGLVEGINTTGSAVSETWADGDVLYNHPLIVGALSKTKPTAPLPIVVCAIVVKAGNNGSLFVRISPEY